MGEVQPKLLNTFAALLTEVARNPVYRSDLSLAKVVDFGGIGDSGMDARKVQVAHLPAAATAPSDKVISPCEVITSGFLDHLFDPDVQLFRDGVYSPPPDNAVPDSLSLALKFRAHEIR